LAGVIGWPRFDELDILHARNKGKRKIARVQFILSPTRNEKLSRNALRRCAVLVTENTVSPG
jgi:hypothetical protein